MTLCTSAIPKTSQTILTHLWGRSHESFSPLNRRILSVSGKGATHYLQGLVTCDLRSEVLAFSPLHPKFKYSNETLYDNVNNNNLLNIRPICFLDNKGRVLTDAMLWKRPILDYYDKESHPSNFSLNIASKLDSDVEYLIDVPGDTADMLLQHLLQYRLRKSKHVMIGDLSEQMSVHCIYGTWNTHEAPDGFMTAMDPRHPSLGVRVLSTRQNESLGSKIEQKLFPSCPGTYSLLRKLAGIGEGMELQGKTAIETNQDFLHALSFSKGCYLGQELTARSFHVGVIRKRILPIVILDKQMEIPQPWVKAQMRGRMQMNTTTSSNYIANNPPLPTMSVQDAGMIVSLLRSSNSMPVKKSNMLSTTSNTENNTTNYMVELQDMGVRGASIVNSKDGKTIGQVLSSPSPGSSVLLAQLRLDRVCVLGETGNDKDLGTINIHQQWNPMNSIQIGNHTKEYRCLPYIPQWWPTNINFKSGKKVNI